MMHPAARRKVILSKIEAHGSVQVSDLAEALGVSKVTIRNDLDELSRSGHLIRTHGGAITAERRIKPRTISQAVGERAKEKRAIASVAVTLIKDGQSLIIDTGSTTAYLAPLLEKREVTVMTNSLLVVEELMHSESVDLLLSGGILFRPSMGLMGGHSREFYQQIHADWCFLGGSGYSVEHGVFCASLIEADSKQMMIKSASKVCLLADSSKREKLYLAKVCDWSAIDYLVTDAIEAEMQVQLKELGVQVILAERL